MDALEQEKRARGLEQQDLAEAEVARFWGFYAKWVGEILDAYRAEGLPESDGEGHCVDDMICDLLANLSTKGAYH